MIKLVAFSTAGARVVIEPWWQNFREGQIFNNQIERDELLAKWNATSVKHDSGMDLYFETERDVTMFLLRWV